MSYKKEYALLAKEMRKVKRSEERIFAPGKSEPSSSGIREKIPQKTYDALEKAFEKGFRLIFEKGGGIIEKTGSIEKARLEAEKYEESLSRMVHENTLKAVDKSASSRAGGSKTIGTADGTLMGIAGMGLPDIPVFLGLLLKTCYEIGAAYGCDYRDEKEKKYTIAVLRTAFSSGDEKHRAADACDDLAGIIERGEDYDFSVTDSDIEDIAAVLATDMVVAKFIQGLTIVGVVGGLFNYRMLNKLTKTAKLKYKKRFTYRHMLRLKRKFGRD